MDKFNRIIGGRNKKTTGKVYMGGDPTVAAAKSHPFNPLYDGKSQYETPKGATGLAARWFKPKGYKKGGKVKKTGPAKLHKGERVLNVKQAAKFEKAKKKYFGIKKYGRN